MTATIDKIEAELRDLGFNASIAYGDDITTELTDKEVPAVVIVPNTALFADDLVLSNSDKAIEIELFVSCIAETDKNAVQLTIDVLKALRFRTENGQLGRPADLPALISTRIRVLMSDVASVSLHAVPHGKYWRSNNSIRLALTEE